MDFKLEIEKMRCLFEKNRPNKLRLHRPWWMFADDELSKIYSEKTILLEQGEIYYSYLLQANVKLFQKFPPFDYPAQIVYSATSDTDENPLLLKDIVEKIYSYKYSNEDPPNELIEIVENIRNEKDRTAFSVECYMDSAKLLAKMQTIMVYRKHLPTRILKGSVLPVIACPKKCDSVLILPSEYWSNEFIRSWFTQL
ncbi:MAG: hypothetical protein IJD88_06595 [Clostridia bacterium]|nr:hypothetical protein [Clostridia bacterium]